MGARPETDAERLARLDREAAKAFRTHKAMRRFKSYRQKDVLEEAARQVEAARDKKQGESK